MPRVSGTMLRQVMATCLILACARAENDASFSTKYDNVDLDEILTNERLLASYVACLRDRGPCSPDGKELKKNLPEAVADDCRRCSEAQREGSARVMHFLIDQRPDDWNQLERMYDPEGLYKKRYLKSVELANNEEENHDPTTEDA